MSVAPWKAVVSIGVIFAALGIVFWWLRPLGNDEPFDLEASVQFTCQTVMATPYDSVMTIKVGGDTVVGESYFSGRDSRHVSTRTNSQGEITTRGETIIKDGTLYSRSSASDDPTQWGSWTDQGTGHEAFHFACFSLGDAVSGDVSGDSDTQGELHIVQNIVLSLEEGTEKREFWADSNGKPLRGRRTFNIPASSGAGGASGQAATTIVADVVYSGFGEANTITAPELAGS